MSEDTEVNTTDSVNEVSLVLSDIRGSEPSLILSPNETYKAAMLFVYRAAKVCGGRKKVLRRAAQGYVGV